MVSGNRAYLTRSNSFSACSPETPSSSTRPLGSKSVTLKVLSEPSRPGINSARKVTFIPGLAHRSREESGSRSRLRFGLLFLFITTAPIAPSPAAATANPPNSRFVLFFIGFQSAFHAGAVVYETNSTPTSSGGRAKRIP